ncbi:U-scoloptoxin(01)-Er1a-like [Homarus americanus]|nr:U-scoloptoxin(01)-Er1a-like [Homarus americanus]
MMKVVLLLVTVLAAASARMSGRLPGGFHIDPGFSCESRAYGFYADIQNSCSAYHICHPVYDETEQLVEMAHFTFLCGPGTIFDQELLACAHPKKAFPCSESDTIYEHSNLQLLIDWREKNRAQAERRAHTLERAQEEERAQAELRSQANERPQATESEELF